MTTTKTTETINGHEITWGDGFGAHGRYMAECDTCGVRLAGSPTTLRTIKTKIKNHAEKPVG
jgi:hypothetical protein